VPVPVSIAGEDPAETAANLLGEGFWSFRPISGQLTLSLRWKQLLGYLDSEVQPSLAEWLAMVHPADQDRLRKALLDGRRPFPSSCGP